MNASIEAEPRLPWALAWRPGELSQLTPAMIDRTADPRTEDVIVFELLRTEPLRAMVIGAFVRAARASATMRKEPAPEPGAVRVDLRRVMAFRAAVQHLGERLPPGHRLVRPAHHPVTALFRPVTAPSLPRLSLPCLSSPRPTPCARR